MFKFLKKDFQIKEDIISFKITDNETQKVTDFYKASPFPNYKKDDNKQTILEKGDKNLLAKQFKKFIGFNKKVLELGCGTGQLSMYFSIGSNNEIIAFDPTLTSLNLAKEFAKKNEITNIKFVNADIFDDVLSEDYFDYIWCNGVLHHTKDPYKAFETVIKSLNKNGYILIGLYNKFGRFRTIIRKYLYKIFGKKILEYLDPTLRSLKFDKEEKDAWIRDQYIHPIESLHTIDEVLIWFEKNNCEFVSSIPSSDFDYDYLDIFEKKSPGSYYSRIINQISMLFSKLGSDGGLFVLIGKKR